MKRISATLALTAALSFGVSAYAQTKPVELKDVPAGHWAKESIKIAADCGIIQGFPDGTFRGQQAITRYQAAAIVARLITAIKNGECSLPKGADGQTDPASAQALQNAVQELSADLAQLGVRVTELEDNAVSQDDLARVEELATQAGDLAKAAAAANGGDPEALKSLLDQVDAASTAADTALAQSRELQTKIDELTGRVDELDGRVGEIATSVEGQADSISALNDLVVLLNQDVLSLQDRVAQLEEGGVGTGGGSQEDLDALREFTTLLRRDQTALQDRVADVEARITGIDTRVAALEKDAFTISGSISLNYRVSRTWLDGNPVGPDFDIDRLGLTTSFSSGTSDDVDDDTATDFADFGGSLNPTTAVNTTVNNSGAFVQGDREGKVSPTVKLNFALKPRNLLSDPSNFPAGTITLGLTLTSNDFRGSDIDPISLKLTGLSAKFSVGAAPVVFSYGIKPGFKFTNYAFNNDGGRGDGFTADISGAGLLPFSPSLTVVYGSKGPADESFGAAVALPYTTVDGAEDLKRVSVTTASRGQVVVTFVGGDTVEKTFDSGDQSFVVRNSNAISSVTFAPSTNKPGDAADGDHLYFRGVKGALSIIPGLNGSVYFAEEGPSVDQAGATTTLYGAAFNGKLFGLVDLEGEHNISLNVGVSPAQNASYVKAGVGLGIFSLGGNYRFVEKDYANLGGDGAYVYKTNQSGFGVNLGVNLGVISLAGYYDTRSRLAAGDLVNGPKADTLVVTNDAATNFGISLTLRLLGFDITPSYNAINESLTGVENRDSRTIAVDLKHDGSKPDALIGGLNLAAGFDSRTDIGGGSDRTRLYGYLDFTIGAAPGFSVTPRAWFNSENADSNFGVRADLGLPFLFGSRLSVSGAYDTSTTGTLSSGTTWASAGLAFNPSILANSTWSISAAYRADANRNGRSFGPSFAAPRDGWGSNALNAGGTLAGLYSAFSYYDLVFAYGVFNNMPNAGVSGWGQEFSIAYTVKF